MKIQFNLKANTPNKNGRIYSEDVLKKAIEKFNEKKVKQGKALGEFLHPKYDQRNGINHAFKINEIEQEDEHWAAEIEILSTPKGDILKEILDPNKYEIVPMMTVGEITKGKDGTTVVTKIEIIGVSIEPNYNCV